jgi:hypothetical protein
MNEHTLIEVCMIGTDDFEKIFESPPDATIGAQAQLSHDSAVLRGRRESAIRRADRHVIGRGMKPALLMIALLLALPGSVRADGQWVLEKSTLIYHLSHPLHETEGISHAARGKAVCNSGQCDVLIAAPVKSFDSGDSNRDLHMIQTTHGAQYPLITVRIRLPESASGPSTMRCDLEIEFAGQTVQYKQIEFQLLPQGTFIRISGTIPATLSDFKISPPSFLTVPVKNEVPVRVETTWRPM